MYLIDDILFFATQMSVESRIIAWILGALFALVLFLRVYLCFGFKGTSALINRSAKLIKTKEDISKLSVSPLAWAAKEYMAMAEKGGRIDAVALAKMDIGRNRLLLLNFVSMSGLIRALEAAFLPFAVFYVLAVGTSNSGFDMVIVTGLIYIALRISAAVFDVETARDFYVASLAHVLVRDIGRFFPVDASSAVYTFGSDLKDYLSRQSAMYNDVLNKIGNEFTTAITSNISAMTLNIESTLNAIAKQDSLDASIEKWSMAINKSAEAQDGASQITEKIGAAMINLANTLDGAGSHMATHAKVMEESKAELKDDIKRLTTTIDSLNIIAAGVSLRNEALSEELTMLRENQRTLELSIARYETSMKELTAQIGDAMGNIVSYHLSSAQNSIAESISDSLKLANASNIEQAERMRSIFEELFEQSKYQTQLLLQMRKDD